jgi:hypothetical protein
MKLREVGFEDGIGLGFCPVAGSGFYCVEPLSYLTKDLYSHHITPS